MSLTDKTAKTPLCADHTKGKDNEQFFENQLLTYKQAAQYLGISKPYLKRLKAQGLMPYVLVGDRAIRFRMSSLNRWIEDREIT